MFQTGQKRHWLGFRSNVERTAGLRSPRLTRVAFRHAMSRRCSKHLAKHGHEARNAFIAQDRDDLLDRCTASELVHGKREPKLLGVKARRRLIKSKPSTVPRMSKEFRPKQRGRS